MKIPYPALQHSPSLIRFHQSIQNQTVKRVVSRQKQPSQVQQALAAVRDFPTETFKPGEFTRGRSGGTAADGRLKAADFINDPARVGKGVNMGTVDNDSVGGTGDRLKALCTANIFFFLHNLFFRNGFLGGGSAFVIGRITKEYRSGGYHILDTNAISLGLI